MLETRSGRPFVGLGIQKDAHDTTRFCDLLFEQLKAVERLIQILVRFIGSYLKAQAPQGFAAKSGKAFLPQVGGELQIQESVLGSGRLGVASWDRGGSGRQMGGKGARYLSVG